MLVVGRILYRTNFVAVKCAELVATNDAVR